MLLRMHTYIMGYVAAHAYICCYGAVTVVMLLRMHIYTINVDMRVQLKPCNVDNNQAYNAGRG